MGDLHFRFAQDDTGLALAFGLGLATHGVLKLLRDDDVPDLNRLDRDSPRGCTLVDDPLQVGVHFGPPDQDICQSHLPDDFPQSGLGCPGDRCPVIFNLQGCLLRIPYQPEKYRIDVDRDGIFREGFLRVERRYHHAVIDPGGSTVDDRYDPEQAGALQPAIFSQAQHHSFFPLFGYF